MLDSQKAKGFIRIFEIIIFTFFLFAILIPTFFKYNDVNDWGSAKNLLISNDLLFSLDKSNTLEDALITDPITDGINITTEHEADIMLMKNITDKIFPIIYDYEYEIKNVPSARISIGCIGSDSDENWLKENILTPSYPTYEFAVKHMEIDNLSSNVDTYIIFGQKNLETYRENITDLLRKGKGFVLIANISSSPDPLSREMFSLDYQAGGSALKGIMFRNLSEDENSGISKRYIYNLERVSTIGTGLIGRLYLKTGEYAIIQNTSGKCVNISSCSPCLHENESCSISGMGKVTLFEIDPLRKEWIDIKVSSDGINPRNYIFEDTVPLTVPKSSKTLLTDGTNSFANAVTGNYSYSYETEPRLFWMYDFNRTKDDLKLLLKTGLIWSSGEHYFMFNKPVPGKRDVATHFYTGLRNSSIPFTIKLYSWGY